MKTPFDHDVRSRIRHDLDSTMIVEAAAGTGKTTELVERMVNVLAGGHAAIAEIVAVTFTEKAAGELKLRLRDRLERERHSSPGDVTRHTNVERALAGLEEAHINTIHGFCADLLRERPVEAGVDPAFEVLIESEAERLYGAVFDAWFTAGLDDPPDGIRRALHRPGWSDEDEGTGPVDRLRRAGWDLVAWRDFPRPWQRDASFDRLAAMRHLLEQLTRVAALTSTPHRRHDNLSQDTLFLRHAAADLEQQVELGTLDWDALEARLVLLSKDTRLRSIRKGAGAEFGPGLSRATVLTEKDRLRDMAAAFVRSADADLAALLQRELWATIDLYEAEKARLGRLDFLDLLLRARDLLRSDRDVRHDFQRRFKRLFVDEFQDTDPVQAEVLMLLAADDERVDDWRSVRPRSGALFIVADPKQSIYRFRRADVGIYAEVKHLLRRSRVEAVPLSTSFRSVPTLQWLVNGAFGAMMKEDDRRQQANYVPLRPSRPPVDDQPSCVVLPVPRPYGVTRVSGAAIERSLPGAVAAFLDWLLHDSHWKITERSAADAATFPVAPRHVCLLFRRFDSWTGDVTRPYTEALEARGIPHLLVGGRAFEERDEVETMIAALTAIEWPDDELAVFAVLRGSLFAIPEAALLAYRLRHGRFHPFHATRDANAADGAEICEALDVLRQLHLHRHRRPVSATVSALLDATRAHAGFALRPSGEQVLANVLHIVELARRFEASGGISFRGFVDDMRAGRFGDISEAPILEEGGDGVRLMTVHRAKGLEFPVVVLADMTANGTARQARLHVDADRQLCAMRLLNCAPLDLLEREAVELERDEAEALRIAYVAATRARDLLVVPAVGDGPYDEKWLAAINPMIYPPAGQRRTPETAPGCPTFGRDSVVDRPNGDPASKDTVAPGLYRFTDRERDDEVHGVVWWDPHALHLDVRPSFGVRQTELIGREANPTVVQADLESYRQWERSREAALAKGAMATVTLETVRDRAERLAADGVPPPADVPIVNARFPGERPRGARFGTLVHELLAIVPLDATRDVVERLADIRGRALGASTGEIGSAGAVVATVLRHDVLDRARVAARQGRCRREMPATIRTDGGRLVEGQVDLAFEEADGWYVVDFKTDQDISTQESQHRWQVCLYAEAVARSTGRPARGILLQV